MTASESNEARERVAQLTEVVAAFSVTASQLREKLKQSPTNRAELERKLDLNSRTLESLLRSLRDNEAILRRLLAGEQPDARFVAGFGERQSS